VVEYVTREDHVGGGIEVRFTAAALADAPPRRAPASSGARRTR
jgi:hypothetical protein